MTRKDTIIIAVLVNAAILFALFISAIRSEKKEESLALSSQQILQAETSQPMEGSVASIKMAEGDEIDQMLKAQFPSQFPQTNSSSARVESNLQTLEAKELSSTGFPTNTQNTLSLSDFSEPEQVKTEVAVGEAGFKEVRVKKGDALEKIARANRCTVDELMKWNNLRSTALRVGQVLKVKGDSKAQKSSVNLTGLSETSSAGAVYYTVKNGDNPWTIAVKNHIKVHQLLQLNNLDEEKARQLKPGDKLRIK